MSSLKSPNNELELSLVAQGVRFVLGIDEVGRGAIAGPVSVGITVIDHSKEVGAWPTKLRDSKLIAAKVRENLVPEVQAWVDAHAIGSAQAEEIDAIGIVEALALAARRAFGSLPETLIREMWASKSVAILDGSHNWLSGQLGAVQVITQTKADRDCAIVAAASVLAKVQRDAIMVELSSQDGRFEWASNKGYASTGHIDALKQFGPSDFHRKTWLNKILGTDQLLDL